MNEERQNTARKARRRRRTGLRADSGIVARLITLLIVVAVCVLSVTIFFKVRQIQVQGNTIYSEQTVIEASGIRMNDPLVTMKKSEIAGRIKAELPYVEEIRIVKQLPDKVILTIRESSAVFAVQDEAGNYWLVSFSGRVLEEVGETVAQTHPIIIGITLKNPEVGDDIIADNPESLEAAKLLAAAMEGTGIAKEAAKLDVTKPYDIVLWYKDQYEVRLGGTDRLDYKIDYLIAVLEQLEEYQIGTIDLTFETEKIARFIPW